MLIGTAYGVLVGLAFAFVPSSFSSRANRPWRANWRVEHEQPKYQQMAARAVAHLEVQRKAAKCYDKTGSVIVGHAFTE